MKCPKCGYENSLEVVRCISCGEDLAYYEDKTLEIISAVSFIISIGLVDLGVIIIYDMVNQLFVISAVFIYFFLVAILNAMPESMRNKINYAPEGMTVTNPFGIGCTWIANIVFGFSMGQEISEKLNIHYEFYDLSQISISFLIILMVSLSYYILLFVSGKFFNMKMQFSIIDPFKKVKKIESNKVKLDVNIISGIGIINQEGASIRIFDNYGMIYNPVNLPEEFRQIGLKVKFKLKRKPARISFRRRAEDVEVLEIVKE